MKNLIYSIVLLVLALISTTQPAHAAFPAYYEPAVSAKTEKRSFEEFINATIEKYNLPVPAMSDGEVEGSGALSIAALALAIAGFGALLLAAHLWAAFWLIPATVFGITAIVLGAIGMRRRPLRGMGIAALALGVVDVAILLIIGFFAFIFAILNGDL
ncbi:MAG: hypothetical protein K0R82_1445 [Flavipsychrobacter sp.]|jgi:hypothetical protein|nr:hypothetical protein [Flavipsychrobacter sp.]